MLVKKKSAKEEKRPAEREKRSETGRFKSGMNDSIDGETEK